MYMYVPLHRFAIIQQKRNVDLLAGMYIAKEDKYNNNALATPPVPTSLVPLPLHWPSTYTAFTSSSS